VTGGLASTYPVDTTSRFPGRRRRRFIVDVDFVLDANGDDKRLAPSTVSNRRRDIVAIRRTTSILEIGPTQCAFFNRRRTEVRRRLRLANANTFADDKNTVSSGSVDTTCQRYLDNTAPFVNGEFALAEKSGKPVNAVPARYVVDSCPLRLLSEASHLF